MQTRIKTTEEIENMRISGKMLAVVLLKLKDIIAAGVSTKELADIAAQEVKALGGKAAFLGYQGFPDVLCVSVNDEVVHGIPSARRKLKDGDLVSLDFGVKYKDMITDSAISMIVGNDGDKTTKNLIDITKRSLNAGIDIIRDGVHVGNIGAVVQGVLEKAGFGVVRDLVGHGVGHELHEQPNIPNYGHRANGPILKSGMTIAIEPMSTIGSYEVYTASDGWTVKTRDGSLAAHFEHTVLVTPTGAEILTTV